MKLLIVESNEQHRSLLAEIAKSRGFDVACVTDKAELENLAAPHASGDPANAAEPAKGQTTSPPTGEKNGTNLDSVDILISSSSSLRNGLGNLARSLLKRQAKRPLVLATLNEPNPSEVEEMLAAGAWDVISPCDASTIGQRLLIAVRQLTHQAIAWTGALGGTLANTAASETSDSASEPANDVADEATPASDQSVAEESKAGRGYTLFDCCENNSEDPGNGTTAPNESKAASGEPIDFAYPVGTPADRLRWHQQLLAELNQLATNPETELNLFLTKVAGTACSTLGVATVSLWLHEEAGGNTPSLRCVEEFGRSQRQPLLGRRLVYANNQSYFDSLVGKRTRMQFAASGCEWQGEEQLMRRGVVVLDVPVRIGHRLAGMLCHESNNPERRWTIEEESFVASLADLVCVVLERSERIRLERLLLEKEKRETDHYSLAAQCVSEGLWDWDLTTNTIHYSPRWKRMLGFAEADLGNSPEEWMNRVHPDDREQLRHWIREHLEGREAHPENEHRVMHADGQYRWMLCRGVAARDVSRRAYRMSGSQTDVTDRKSALEQLLHDAFHDELTGLANRALLIDRLGNAVSRSKRLTDYRFGVLILGLDRFKNINDSLGHKAGDLLIRESGSRLESCLRAGDTIARLGGDEFTIVVEDLADVEEMVHIARQVHDQFSVPFQVEGHEVFITASIGMVLGGVEPSQPEELIRDARTAMYRAKARGHRLEVFDKKMHDRAVSRLRLETDLRKALVRDELCLHYQPIVNLETGRVIAFEALVRWNHPTDGLLSPDHFVPLAEETGMIIAMGKWVLHEACRQIKAWRDQMPELQTLHVSVNLSRRQFSDPGLVDFIRSTLQEVGIDGEHLHLEITESMMMEEPERLTKLMLKLKELNIRLHIDDFGTGYSSLSYLHSFPIDTLKIDRAFVSRMEGEARNLEIVRTITTLAQNLDLDVIAEGVETSAQLEMLRDLKCDFGQGFYFATPLEPATAYQLLRSNPNW